MGSKHQCCYPDDKASWKTAVGMQIKWEAKSGILLLTFWSELIAFQWDILLQLFSPSTGDEARKKRAKIIT